MRQTQILAVMVLSACVVSTVVAAPRGRDPQSQIVYQEAHGSMVVTAPRGWAFDPADSGSQGLRAVLYPVGSTSADARSVIYVKTVSKEGCPTLTSLIAADLERRSALSTGLKVVSGDPLPTARGPKASVRHLSGASEVLSVAYAETPGVYVMLILSSKSEVDQKAALLAFAEFVKSYDFSTVTGGIIQK